jgi:hypothetical protein
MSIDDAIFEEKYSSPRTYPNRAQKIYHMKWKGRQNVGSKDN